ncbi:Uma2 family endonuclease [Leptospira sp. 'Mane']|uniref:Uma2 family endonuclease n=1 Tax=Leptospira sp. 'Mane' TaxID=3387407 RepID=UPI00398AA847
MAKIEFDLEKDFPIASYGPRYIGWRATPKEFQELPRDGYVYRIVDGVLHLELGKSFQDYKIQKRIVSLIQNAIGMESSGEILEETNLFLPSGEILLPDICYFRSPIACIDKTGIHSVPEMIVEILSSSLYDLQNRMMTYLKNGIREYWLVEPTYKKISRFLNKNGQSWDIESGSRLTSEYLERLELNSGDLFHFFNRSKSS